MSTLQVDLQEPQRFDLEYQASDGTRQRPYMIHRALFGSVERFFGILVEHYAGAFPPWLAPVQAVAIPVAERHLEHLNQVAQKLRDRGIRVEVDDSDETVGKRIRNAEIEKIPYVLVWGDKESEDAIAVREHGGEQSTKSLAQLVEELRKAATV